MLQVRKRKSVTETKKNVRVRRQSRTSAYLTSDPHLCNPRGRPNDVEYCPAANTLHTHTHTPIAEAHSSIPSISILPYQPAGHAPAADPAASNHPLPPTIHPSGSSRPCRTTLLACSNTQFQTYLPTYVRIHTTYLSGTYRRTNNHQTNRRTAFAPTPPSLPPSFPGT